MMWGARQCRIGNLSSIRLGQVRCYAGNLLYNTQCMLSIKRRAVTGACGYYFYVPAVNIGYKTVSITKIHTIFIFYINKQNFIHAWYQNNSLKEYYDN